ncbi:MAG: hypothetical protein IT166_08085 [Bryobacterales bacterium]|nr:hypothetical protein [Bryobacterales bacterium]
MSIFWENAARLLDAALSAAQSGSAASDSMTVLIGQEGGIHVLPDNDWPLDRLALDRGARMAYRVTRENGRVAVSGLDGCNTCRLETEKPASKMKALLRDQPRYFLS